LTIMQKPTERIYTYKTHIKETNHNNEMNLKLTIKNTIK